MSLTKQIVVRTIISGDVINFHPLGAGLRSLESIELRPFPMAKGRDYISIPKEFVKIEVDRWFGSRKLFDGIKNYWYSSNEVTMDNRDLANAEVQRINQWLAIVDHFGFDAAFDRCFVERIIPYARLVYDFGYVASYEDETDKTRIFNKVFYDPYTFKMKFRNFAHTYGFEERIYAAVE
jgi:hypothetical protein